MMITPTQIRERADSLAHSDGGHLSETAFELDVRGIFQQDLLERWRELALEVATSDVISLVALDALGDELDLQRASLQDVQSGARIRLKKKSPEGVYYFFTSIHLPTLLDDRARISSARFVFIAEDFESFDAATCSFAKWPAQISLPDASGKFDPTEPGKLVRDLSGQGIVPLNLGPFLLKGKIPTESEAFRTWALESTKKLLVSLVNEVWLRPHDSETMVSVFGPRPLKLKLGMIQNYDANVFNIVTEVAAWVYSNPQDVEVRHTLFTYELAREWPEADSLYARFAARSPIALESAKTAYRVHIRQSSKDTLKSLSELRKTLSEETAQVASQTHDLISALWRDFAIAASALLARVALIYADKRVVADSRPIQVLLVGTAVFLVFSLYMTLSSNSRFMRIAAEGRDTWKQRLFGFLPEDDLKALAEEPIRKSVEAYNKARYIVVFLYISIIGLLVFTAFPNVLTRIIQLFKAL
jgi:hypothetical protein